MTPERIAWCLSHAGELVALAAQCQGIDSLEDGQRVLGESG
jgi:hypothetical protein